VGQALQISGATVKSARDFAARRRGTTEYDAFLDALGDDERDMLDRPIRSGEWFDVPTYAAMLGKAATHLAPDASDEFLREGGKYIVDDSVNTLYRAFFAIARPSFVLRGSALMWRTVFRGSRLTIERSSRRSVLAAVHSPFCSHDLCQSICGGMLSSLTHGGARSLVLDHHHCQTSGGPNRCEFGFHWR